MAVASAASIAWIAAAGPEAGGLDPAKPGTWPLRDVDLYGVAARGSRVWAVGYWGTVLRSQDAGASWEKSPTPTHSTLYGVDFADDLRGWAVGADGLILRSTDGGASWTRQSARVQDDGTGEVHPLASHLFGVAAVSGDEAWAVGDLGVVLHVSDGATWRPVQLSEDVYGDDEPLDRIFNAVRFVDPQHGWIVGEFGTILRTRDGGASWSAAHRVEGAVAEPYLYDVAASDALRVAAVGLAGSVFASEDGGDSWRLLHTDTTAPLYGVVWANPVGAVAGDRGEIFTTDDGGHSWLVPSRPPIFNWLQDVAEGSETALYAVGEHGIVLRSRDGGRRWEQLRGAEPPPRAGFSLPSGDEVVEPALGPPPGGG